MARININREYYTYILVDDRLWLYTDEKEIAVKFKIQVLIEIIQATQVFIVDRYIYI